jgi:hypothetical protein
VIILERIKLNKNITVFKIDPKKDEKILDRLLSSDYIIIYDESICKQGNNLLLASCNYSNKEYYKIIKQVYPYSYAVYNMAEIGYCSCNWYKY